MPFFNRNRREPEISDPADIDGFFDDRYDSNAKFTDEVDGIDVDNGLNVPQDDEYYDNSQQEYVEYEQEPLEDDSKDIEYESVYGNRDDNGQPSENNQLYQREPIDEDYDDDGYYGDADLHTPPSQYIDNPMRQQSRAMVSQSYSSNVGSEEQAYDLISGIADIPLKYRNDNYVPELVMPSLQYNLIKGLSERSEWQVKARCLIRKHQMNNPDFKLSERDIAGITYINDFLLWRATDGFERKMSIQNIQGTLEELNTEASPIVSQPKKKGILGGLFS